MGTGRRSTCGTSADDWLCPGWERCAQPHQECTKSRCCVDAGNSCYLNASALNLGEGWRASCMPTMHTDGAGGAGGHGGCVGGSVSLGGGKWLCPSEWMEHVHEAVELAEWYVD